MLDRKNELIQFAMGEKEKGKLPLHNTLIHQINTKAMYSVCRKSTNEDDFLHYLSWHTERTKSSLVIRQPEISA